jgi:hypothetical protein
MNVAEDLDPITKIGMDYGCMSCGIKTDKFYFVNYYILPSRLVRKRHRDKNRCAVYCCSCYEAHEELDIEIDGKPVVVNKANRIDTNSLRCFMCGSEMQHGSLYGVLTILLLMRGSGVENEPLAVFCTECAEGHTIEL